MVIFYLNSWSFVFTDKQSGQCVLTRYKNIDFPLKNSLRIFAISRIHFEVTIVQSRRVSIRFSGYRESRLRCLQLSHHICHKLWHLHGILGSIERCLIRILGF